MIDTIRAKIITDTIGNLDKCTPEIGTDYLGEAFKRYKFNNLSVQVKELPLNQFKISIIGSLCTFMYGTNLVRFKRIDIKAAVKQLSERIGIDLSDAVLTRIDLGANLYLSKHPKCYTILLAHKSRYKRSSIKDFETVYFETRSIKLSFYDKVKEFKNTNKGNRDLRSAFASFLKEKNILRYELRLFGILQKRYKSSQIMLKHLYDNIFYRKLVDLWYQRYCSILKEGLKQYSNSVKFEQALILRGVAAIGGIGPTLEYLDAWSKYNNFNKSKKSRQKKKLIKLNEGSGLNAMIKELDQKISFEKEFYL